MGRTLILHPALRGDDQAAEIRIGGRIREAGLGELEGHGQVGAYRAPAYLARVGVEAGGQIHSDGVNCRPGVDGGSNRTAHFPFRAGTK